MEKVNNENDKKIKLVYHDLEGNIATESVWASKEEDYYRIKNVPFFAPNLAYNDLVSVEDDDGELFFDSLINPSGHSTIQIIIPNQNDFEKITSDLTKLKCDWEGSHLKEYISVDVPKGIDYSKVKQYLERQHSENKLDYKEACLAHKV